MLRYSRSVREVEFRRGTGMKIAKIVGPVIGASGRKAKNPRISKKTHKFLFIRYIVVKQIAIAF